MPRAGAKVMHEVGCSRCESCAREPHEVGAEDAGEAESKATGANARVVVRDNEVVGEVLDDSAGAARACR